MRDTLRTHAPALAAFLLLVLVAAGFATTLRAEVQLATTGVGVLPAVAIDLPHPDQDSDGDTFGNNVDVWFGDLELVLDARRLRTGTGSNALPYLVVGTEDDQWRLGAGREREWRHVMDYDSLGREPGAPGWSTTVLRTGAWWVNEPMAGAERALFRGNVLDADTVPPGTTWPQRFHINVRDDRPVVSVRVELWDAEPKPDRLLGGWDILFDVLAESWVADGRPVAQSEQGWLGSAFGGAAGVEVSLRAQSALPPEEQEALARRWAPIMLFSEGERFYPTNGEALAQFHGFVKRKPDYRTWSSNFNNGRDAYRLLLADFTGDRRVDHEDAALMTDVLRAGDAAHDTVYAHVTQTTNDKIIIQYWFIYFYNFVRDESGQDVPRLAHNGDREFIQLRFDSLADARNGTPSQVAYSQHYRGIRINDARPGAPPFVFHAHHPTVYVARGSHASFPAPGDDSALRPGYVGFGDVFDGRGEHWSPEDYELQVLGTQTWHAGYLWGPVTRFNRDLGTSGRPILQHDFRYPFIDPLYWGNSLDLVAADRLYDLYGREPTG
jgi:hypothetical protein